MSDEKPQSQRFKETARDLGCDEGEKAFDDKLKRIVPKPTDKKEAPAK